MRTRASTIALVGTLGLTGLAGGVVLAPALAVAATSEQSTADAVGDRVDRLKEALQGLVDDGTISGEQRDAVAQRLAEELPPRGLGHGQGRGQGQGHGPGHGRGLGHGKHLALDVASTALGITEQELREQLRSGKSIAQVAQERGVDLGAVTKALEDAARERLQQAVTDGRLTQAEADEKAAELTDRIADAVQREGLGKGRGHGWGPGGRPGAPEDEAEQPQEGTNEPSVYRS